MDDSVDDFLARERAALGGDTSLFDSNDVPSSTNTFELPSTDFPDLGDGTSTPPPLPEPSSSSLLGGFSSAGGFPSIETLTASSGPKGGDISITGTGDAELDKFESEFPDVSEFMPAEIKTLPPQNFQYGESPYAPAPLQSSSTGFGAAPIDVDDGPEPEAITRWREQQAEDIKKRDERSKAKREETITKAEQAIDQFYEEYNASKEKSIKENKENEAAFLEAQSAALSAGTTWERITNLIGLENSQSKTLAKGGAGGSDLARMKEILLKLRRQGESAPGAKGY